MTTLSHSSNLLHKLQFQKVSSHFIYTTSKQLNKANQTGANGEHKYADEKIPVPSAPIRTTLGVSDVRKRYTTIMEEEAVKKHPVFSSPFSEYSMPTYKTKGIHHPIIPKYNSD